MVLFLFFSFSLRDRTQVEQLLRYIIEEPPEDAENKRVFKYAVVIEILLKKGYVSTLFFPFYHMIIVLWFRFPFIACEIFTCEIDVILKTLVDEEEVCSIQHYSLLSLFFVLSPLLMFCLNQFLSIIVVNAAHELIIFLLGTWSFS